MKQYNEVNAIDALRFSNKCFMVVKISLWCEKFSYYFSLNLSNSLFSAP